jgi:hypothetical protein
MREIRTYGSERAKAKWLRYSTNFSQFTRSCSFSSGVKGFFLFMASIIVADYWKETLKSYACDVETVTRTVTVPSD